MPLFGRPNGRQARAFGLRAFRGFRVWGGGVKVFLGGAGHEVQGLRVWARMFWD